MEDDFNIKHLKKLTVHEQWKEDFYNKTVNELKTEDRFVNYFKQFHPSAVEQFIKSYAQSKVHWYAAGENLKRWEESKKKRWMEESFKCLISIQQKKLFDAQCLWRAEKTKLEGIDISEDFRYWDDHIFGCRAIPPITEEDIDLFVRFLNEWPLEEPFDSHGVFQEHEQIVKSYLRLDDGWAYSPWYRYCDEQKGTAHLMELPDMRGEREEFYKQLHYEDHWAVKRKTDNEWGKQAQESKPWLSRSDGSFMDDFVKENESPLFYKYYKESKRFHLMNEKNEKPDECLDELNDIPVSYLAIEPAEDWRTSVCMTWERYRREKIIDRLPQAFALYLMHVGTDWKYPGRPDYHKIDENRTDGLSKILGEHIIEGRILNGEPGDLNF